MCYLVFGLTTHVNYQITTTENIYKITVYTANYKWLSNFHTQELASVPVELL
jgi:hypothetical protein